MYRLDYKRCAWITRNKYGDWRRASVNEALTNARNKYAAVDATRELMASVDDRITALQLRDARPDTHGGPLTDDERDELNWLIERADMLQDEFDEWHNDLLARTRINWKLWRYAGGDMCALKREAASHGDWELVERIRRYGRRHNITALIA